MEAVRLRQAKIFGIPNVKTILAIEAQNGRIQQIFCGNTGFTAVILESTREVKPFARRVRAGLLHNPNKFLAAVIEVQGHGDLGDSRRDGLYRTDLKLIDEILVIGSGKPSSFVLVQVDVVPKHLEPGDWYGIYGGAGLTWWGGQRGGPPHFLKRSEMHDDAYGVRLQGNQWQRRSDRITKPEPERNGQLEYRCCIDGGRRVYIPVSHHFIVAVALALGHRKFRPDVEPFAGVFVNLAFPDFNTDIVDQ